MDAEQQAVILALASIVVGFAAVLNETYRVYLLVLYPLAVLLYLLSTYITKIEEHEKAIKEMNKKLAIHERIARLEGKVFK